MLMQTHNAFITILLIGAAMVFALGGAPPEEPEYTTDFRLEDCDSLVPTGGNAFWSLAPGTLRRYEGMEDGELIELEIKVLPDTRPVVFRVHGQWKVAITRVIREREWIDGDLVEVSRNYYARCHGTNDIYYFGEDVDFYEDGVIVGHEGSWLAGRQGAKPGLIMPGLFLLGSRYFQEVAPNIALDRARHAQMGLEIDTPAGTFQDCVKVVETSPLEPGAQSVKFYAPGVGLIVDGAVELIEYDG
jgi:hypothetical protein